MIFKLEEKRVELNSEKIKNDIYHKGEIQTEIKLPKLTLTISDSEWITSKIYEDVERGAYASKIVTKPAENCLEQEISLIVVFVGGLVVNNIANRPINYLLDQLINRLKNRLTKSYSKTKKKNNKFKTKKKAKKKGKKIKE